MLPVEHLGLEDRPEGLDLAVGPGRVDLGPDVADLELGERALEAAEHRAHDGHERRAVVGHQRERHAAQLDRLARAASRIADRLLGRHRPDAQQVAAVSRRRGPRSGRSAHRPGRGTQVERTLEVDVPQLVGRAAARSAGPGMRDVLGRWVP